jgi:hypothetical protein
VTLAVGFVFVVVCSAGVAVGLAAATLAVTSKNAGWKARAARGAVFAVGVGLGVLAWWRPATGLLSRLL